MRSNRETDHSIDQEQSDQQRRTTGATLAALALERVLPAVAKGYGPNSHRRAAERMVENMNKPGFTPGPWQDIACGVAYNEGRVCIRSHGGHWVATTENGGPQSNNARLIAAAPDLYAACEAAFTYNLTSGFGQTMTVTEVNKILEAALARARGQEWGGE